MSRRRKKKVRVPGPMDRHPFDDNPDPWARQKPLPIILQSVFVVSNQCQAPFFESNVIMTEEKWCGCRRPRY